MEYGHWHDNDKLVSAKMAVESLSRGKDVELKKEDVGLYINTVQPQALFSIS